MNVRRGLWRRNREQLVIREDLRDISRLPDLGRIEMLTALIPVVADAADVLPLLI